MNRTTASQQIMLETRTDATQQPRAQQPPTKVKVLPPLPTGGLGLDFNGDTRRVESPLSAPLFVPPRKSSLTPSTSSFVSSPSSVSSSSTGYPFPYTDKNVNQSTSTITDVATRSTTTLSPANSSKTTLTFSTPDKPPSSKSTTPVPTHTGSKRRVAFGMKSSAGSVRSGSGSIDLMSSTTISISSGRSPVPLSKKRSSGQLLMGLGKGLNRVGSVMRRNTAEGTTSLPPAPADLTGSGASTCSTDSASQRRGDGTGYGTWKKGRKWKTQTVVEEDAVDYHKQSYDLAERSVSSQGDGGDEGIGRPFNVEHDLHVSPDLADLPAAWLESLKAQGLMENDLMLISAARRRQHEAQRLPLPDGSNTFYRAPLSAPLNSLSVPGFSDGEPSSRPTGKLLRKFSFEPESPTTPTASSSIAMHDLAPPQNQADDHPRSQSRSRSRISLFDAFDPTYLSYNESTPPPKSKTRSDSESRPTPESYPVSAAESSDFDGDGGAETDDSFSPSPSSKSHRVRVTPASQDSHNHDNPDRRLIEEMLATPKKSKRFSDQLRGFKEHKFDLGEAGEDWGKSILGAAWTSSSSRSKVGSPGTREESDVAVTSADLRRPQISFTVPPPPLQEDDSLPTVFEGPRTPDNQPSALSLAEEPPSSSEYVTRSPPPPRRSRDARHRKTETELPSPSTPPPAEQNHMRKSSDSFGVHFHRSESKSSVELALVTPSSSTEHASVRTASSDRDHEDTEADIREYQKPTPTEEVEESWQRDVDSHEGYKSYLVADDKMPIACPPSPALSNDGLALVNQPYRLAPSPSIPTKLPPESLSTYSPPYAFDWLNRPLPDLRRPPANPHYSLPASAAGESVAPSRASSPISEWDDCQHSYRHPYPHPAQNVIAVNFERTSTPQDRKDDDTGRPIPYVRANSPGSASASIISLPNPHPEAEDEPDPDPLEHIDQAGREERASIALSILSSRNSSDLHDLELGPASVRVAYKGRPGLQSQFRLGQWDMTRIPSNSNGNICGEREVVMGPMSPQANSVCFSDDNSQEAESGTRDALDALGEAARRAFEPLAAH